MVAAAFDLYCDKKKTIGQKDLFKIYKVFLGPEYKVEPEFELMLGEMMNNVTSSGRLHSNYEK